jgi:hypothetical protein
MHNIKAHDNVKVKNSLFRLGMITYSYEIQDIVQFTLKRLPPRLYLVDRMKHAWPAVA